MQFLFNTARKELIDEEALIKIFEERSDLGIWLMWRLIAFPYLRKNIRTLFIYCE